MTHIIPAKTIAISAHFPISSINVASTNLPKMIPIKATTKTVTTATVINAFLIHVNLFIIINSYIIQE